MRTASLLLLLITCACRLGDDYSRPDTPANATPLFINNEGTKQPDKAVTRWWEQLDDDLLNQYVETLLNDNLSLQQAGERIIQAREQATISGSELYPTLGANATTTRDANIFLGFGQTETIYNTIHQATLNSTWQLDLFGRIRSGLDSVKAQYQAQLFDKIALEQSLIAELVRLRVQLAVSSELLQLAVQNTNNQQQIYDIVRRRYDLGAANTGAGDVYLAKENVSTLEADIALRKRELKNTAYQLDVLLGKTPGTHNPLVTAFPLVPPPRDVATCIPAALLDRRPDLLAAELRLKAANADIGVAIADLYPNVSLTGSVGSIANEPDMLFRSDNIIWSIAGNITQRIFNGGALRANIRLRESVARELAAAYGEQILTAMREVESALQSETSLRTELERTGASLDALRNAERIAESRYKRGLQTLRELLEIQQRRYNTQQQWLLSQQQVWTNRINLYLATGGDWLGYTHDTDEPPPCGAITSKEST